jgi:hypothetical protein
MLTFLTVLVVILGCGVAIGLFIGALYLLERRRPRLGAAAAAGFVVVTALLVTWAVEVNDDGSGRCGDGTTRVGYSHGKSTEYVCERTPQ